VDELQEKYHLIRMAEIRKAPAIFIHSSPGVGKSSAFSQLSEELEIDLVDVRLTTLDPVDLRGLPAIDLENNVARWLQAGFLPKDEAGKGGILFIDEINAVPPTMQAAAYQLVLDKEIGEFTLPDGWIVVAAGNKESDRSVAYRLPTALANRFVHIELVVNVEDWLAWARTQYDFDPFVINFIEMGLRGVSTSIQGSAKSVLFGFDKRDVAFATPRSWEFASRLKYLRNKNFPLYVKLINGTIGKRIGTMFYSFIMHRDAIPDVEAILRGDHYEMPPEIDTQYVMNSVLLEAISRNTTPERLDGYIKHYANWFEKSNKRDMIVVIIKDILSRFNSDKYDKDLFYKSEEFNNLLARNSDVLYG